MKCFFSSTNILHPWLLVLLLFIYVTSLSCSSITATTTTTTTTTTTNKFSYSDHCNSTVPESTPTFEGVTNFSFPHYPKTYCTGGNPLFSQNSSANSMKYLSFRTGKVYRTNVDGVLKVHASLILKDSHNMYNYGYDNYSSDGQSQSTTRAASRRSQFGVLSFRLKGFWSESSGKVCMVGFGTTYSKHGYLLNHGAVFKLNYVKNSSIITSLGTGSLESLSSVHDSNYFEPISILMFTEMNNDYGMVLKEIENGGFNRSEFPQGLPLTSSQPTRSLCPIFGSFNQFELTYPSTCDSANNCTHFGGSIGHLPRDMALNLIECSEENQRLRVLMNFFDSSSYDEGWFYTSYHPNTSLIGEGFWDGKKNQLLIVACKILNATGSLENAHVGDCSIRLSLRFPATSTIRDSSTMLGQIWSSKPRNDLEYFDEIKLKTIQDQGVGDQGLTYEYTEIDRVRKLCTSAKQQNKKKKKERYPDGASSDMGFDTSVSSSNGSFTWGFAIPLFLGDHFHTRNGYAMAPEGSMPMVSEMGKKTSLEAPVNISYKIGFSEIPSGEFGVGNWTYNQSSLTYVEISAEGVYDADTGGLCMVGCKKIVTQVQVAMKDDRDCEIFVNFQFPSENSRNKGSGYIKGTIASMRGKSDPLYFEHLDLISLAYVSSVANDNVWRMDFEIILVLISNTLACVFVALQLFHVKKHPETLPFASLLMLAILTFSYMIPLLLNLEALFLQKRDGQNVSPENGKWIEVNEVLVRVITMVAFLLQFRLLRLTWSSRLGDAGRQIKELWTSEKNVFFYVLLPLYVAGALITWLVFWQKENNNHVVVLSPLPSQTTLEQLLGYLRSYAGLVLDGFLLPQIFLNIIGNTRERALSLSYYIGTTFVRLLPHAYDLYRAQTDENAGRFERSYIYANHGVDFYSAAWDIAIPCVSLVFAAIIFLQQRFGGRCIIPRRFREVEKYEKIPVVSIE